IRAAPDFNVAVTQLVLEIELRRGGKFPHQTRLLAQRNNPIAVAARRFGGLAGEDHIGLVIGVYVAAGDRFQIELWTVSFEYVFIVRAGDGSAALGFVGVIGGGRNYNLKAGDLFCERAVGVLASVIRRRRRQSKREES